MFFVFAHGSPQCGEASGGLGDCRYKTHDMDDARAYALSVRTSAKDVEILDGESGVAWEYVCTNYSTRVFDWRERDL